MRIAKKLLALLLCMSMLMQFGITAYAAGGETNLSADISATTAEVGDKITLEISNQDMIASGVKAGFYFDNTKLQVNKITWGPITAYSEEDEDDLTNFATSTTSKKKANTDGSALGVYAICRGVDSECYEGVIVTVIFDVIANGEAKITLREETVGTDAFKSDSVETITVTIGGSEPEPPTPSCDHQGKTYTYVSNGKGTHKVNCECGETVETAEDCFYTYGKCEHCGYECKHDEDDMGSVPEYKYIGNGKHTVTTICDCGVAVGTPDTVDCFDEGNDGICDGCEEQICAHSTTKLVSNNNGTHNVVCAAAGCNHVVESDVTCSATDDKDCTTADKCACGYDVTAAKAHTPAADDGGDCTTAIKCSVCGTVTTEAKANHTSDDNDHNCDVCGTENIEGHTETTTKVTVEEADCDNAPTFRDDTVCSVCGETLATGEVYTEGDALGHAWGTPSYSWSTDYTSCAATRLCEKGCEETALAEVTKEVTPATCQTDEMTSFTATFKETWAEKQVADSIKTGEKDMTNHVGTQTTKYTNNGYDHTKTVTCQCGGTISTETEGHTYVGTTHKCVCEDVEKITIIVQYPAKAPNAFKQEFITAPYGTTVNLTPAPEAIGHTFTGFRDLSTYEMVATAEDNYAYTITEHEVLLEAAYEANNYNITWNLNGGKLVEDGIVLPATVKYDLPIKVLTSNDLTDGKFVEREGYTFSHFEDQDGNRYDVNKDGMTKEGTTWTLGNMPAGDLELTAVWIANEYTLTIKRVRSSDLIAEIKVPCGTKIFDIINGYKIESEAVNEPNQIGVYEFLGWTENWDEITIDAECTMPADDITVLLHQTFTGWTNRGFKGWVYQVKNVTQKTGWTEIDGNWYYLDPETGVRAEGLTRVPYPTESINGITYGPNPEDVAYWQNHKDTSKYTDAETAVFIFDENGKFQQTTGIMGNRYAYKGMIGWHHGLVEVGGEYYYFIGDELGGGNIGAEGDTYVKRLNGIKGFKSGDVYNFAGGKLSGANGIVDGKYYENSKLMKGLGLIKVGNEYIYVRSTGQLATGEYWVSNTNGICEKGMYTFDENGFLQTDVDIQTNGIVNGVYYKNGKPYYAGLIEINGEMYYIRSNGQVATGVYYVTKVNDTGIAKGTKLIFGEDGKMQTVKNGIYEESGKYFYYENNELKRGAGVVKLIDENGVTFYIYVRSNGQLATGIYWPTIRNDLLDRGGYDWGTNGRYYPAKG